MKNRKLSFLIFLPLLVVVLLAGNVGVAFSAPSETVRIWVQYQHGQRAAVKADLDKAGAKFHYEFDELEAYVVTLPQKALNGIVNNPKVVAWEEDVPRYLVMDQPAAFKPMFPGFLTDTNDPNGQIIPYGIDKVQARDVWDADRNGIVDENAPTGAGRIVCIIDSGLYTGHEDLAGVNVIGGYSQVDSDPNRWNVDGIGHGTHVAGTIAAMNNSLGVVGVTPGEVSLYIVKIFNDAGVWTTSSNLVNAIYTCRDHGANVISMSLGGSRSSVQERRAFDSIYSAGILSVAAASNDGTTAFSYPASYASVVSVAAIDENNQWADFSNYNTQVELAAPGVSVLSTVPFVDTNTLTVDGVTYFGQWIEYSAYGTASGALVDGGLCTATGDWSGKVVLCQRGDISFYDKVKNVQNSGAVAAVIYNNVPGGFLGTPGEGNPSTIPAISLSQEDGQYLVANKLGKTGTVVSTREQPASGYQHWDGTSMATPHVSAVAALIWSANPSWTNAQIRQALQTTALDLGDPGRDVYYGYGLVQAKAALDSLGGGTPTGALHVTVTTDKTTYAVKQKVYITVLVTDDNGSPVSGATVTVVITTPLNKKTTLTGTTGTDGKALFTYATSTKTGKGTYTVAVTAEKEGYTAGSASTTFVVQ